MPRPWYSAVVRLAALVTCVGLATSRLGLVVHELVGHGGATLAVGGSVTQVQLFWFAGGWIRFEATGGELVIALGGIVIESMIGLALWIVLARRTSLGGRIARAIGAVLVLHATWYLATGTWHGFGDGVQLHRELGDARWLVAIPAAAVTLGAAFLGARSVLGALAATVPGGTRARIGGTAIALVIAGGFQLGAALGEVELRRDATYTATMRPERERVVARELAQWTQQQAREGQRPSEEARARMQRELADRHATFPFAIVLAVLTVLAAGLGAWRARGATEGPIAGDLLARCAAFAVGSIALVIAIDALFH
ncbi:hypothetical protein BH11MYX3_BH11MYX3_13940 [soil metagenome]